MSADNPNQGRPRRQNPPANPNPLNHPEAVKDLLAEAVEEAYRAEVADDPEDKELARLVLHELNSLLQELGMGWIFLTRKDLMEEGAIAAVFREVPALDTLLEELPNHVKEWVQSEPPKANQDEREMWVEEARYLVSQVRKVNLQ